MAVRARSLHHWGPARPGGGRWESLGVRPGQTNSNGKVTLEFGECLGGCDFAPCMLAGDTLHKDLTKEKADELIRQWKGTGG